MNVKELADDVAVLYLFLKKSLISISISIQWLALDDNDKALRDWPAKLSNIKFYLSHIVHRRKPSSAKK